MAIQIVTHIGGRTVAVVSSDEKGEYCKKLGAVGYINKGASGDELLQGIRAVMAGNSYLSGNVAEILAHNQQSDNEKNVGNRLGKRDTEVLTLVLEGLSSPQIGAKLGIATGTVEVHRRNLMHKLDLHSIADLTKYAVREGLVIS